MASLIQIKDGTSGLRLRIDKPLFRLGRSSDNEISIDDELVSKLHAVIEAMQPAEPANGYDYYLQDKDSTNGTFVNDKRVNLYRLKHNDVVRIGLNSFRFVDDAHEDLDETAQLYRSWIPGVYYTGQKQPGGKKAAKKKKK